MMAPSLFDVAAEQTALSTRKPLSQTRLEIERPTPEPLPKDSLFGPRVTHTVCYHGTPLAGDCSKCAAEIPGARKNRKRATP